MKSNIIKIDIDYIFKNKKIWRNFLFIFEMIYTHLYYYRKIKIKTMKIYETGKGAHLLIMLNEDIPLIEVLLIQALTGDRIRETYNYCRYLRNDFRRFNFFAKKKIIRNHKGEIIYKSNEKETKRSRKLLRRLISIMNKIENKTSKNLIKILNR